MALSRDHRERRERSFSNSECRKRFRGSRARGVRPNGCSRAQIKLQIKGRGGGAQGLLLLPTTQLHTKQTAQ